MHDNSLWLGRMRGPVKTAMMVFIGLTLALYVWLIAQHLFSDTAYGMFEMIRPAGRPLVLVMLSVEKVCMCTMAMAYDGDDARFRIEIQPLS